MNEKLFASVWDAIEDTHAQAANMKLRSELMIALGNYIARTGMSQAQAAQQLGVTQPRISDLTRGKINLFGIDALVNMAAAAGLHVEMRVVERGKVREGGNKVVEDALPAGVRKAAKELD
ncbi:MAG: XRE family transcriptional regulator [Burkholderiales bacterium]|nr:XRE family transcriptional regulator [Burkholderiales bacterium]